MSSVVGISCMCVHFLRLDWWVHFCLIYLLDSLLFYASLHPSTRGNLKSTLKRHDWCFQVWFHYSQTDTLATVVWPRSQGHLSGSHMQDTRTFCGEQGHHIQVYISNWYLPEGNCWSLSPKVLSQGFGLQGTGIYDSDIKWVSSNSSQNCWLTSLMNCDFSFLRTSPLWCSDHKYHKGNSSFLEGHSPLNLADSQHVTILHIHCTAQLLHHPDDRQCSHPQLHELFTLFHLFLPDSYWTPGILPDWTRTQTNFMLADHHTNLVSQS